MLHLLAEAPHALEFALAWSKPVFVGRHSARRGRDLAPDRCREDPQSVALLFRFEHRICRPGKPFWIRRPALSKRQPPTHHKQRRKNKRFGLHETIVDVKVDLKSSKIDN
jgi:hypothetical protein